MRKSALILVPSLILTASWQPRVRAAKIEGIVTTAGDEFDPLLSYNWATNDGAEPFKTTGCLAVVYPYTTSAPSLNNSVAQPTSSPVPPYFEGSLSFSLVNTGLDPIETPWTLGIFNSLYTQVIQVLNFELLNATQGQIYGAATAPYDSLQPFQNSVFLGIVIQALHNNVEPEKITINGELCKIQLVNNITSINPLPKRDITGPSFSEKPVSFKDGQIIGVNDQPVALKGINYFGFNNGATMFDGLYAGSNSLTQDFGINLYRIQALGFNTIRIPFSFQDLFKTQVKSFTTACTAVTEAELRDNLSPPGLVIDPNLALPVQAFPEGNNPAICNENLPNDSVYHRFLYIIQFLARNNFYMVIDNHSEDPSIQNPTTWVHYWTQLMTDICSDASSCNRVMVDIFNEPDHAGYTWAQIGPLYLEVMDAVHAVPACTKTLFWIQGTGQLNLPGVNWGDGFATDTILIQQYGLSDPNNFFQTLLTRPYLQQVGISPHIYPPMVSHAGQGYHGAALWYRMYNSFGYLNNIGYGGHLFPIFVGELGSRFGPLDMQSLRDMQGWFLAKAGTGVAHKAVTNIAYWDYNANSPDTGGIVDDSWVNVLWVKINWLIDTVNLQPWYLGAPTPPPPSLTPTPGPSPPYPTAVPVPPAPTVIPGPPTPYPTVVPMPPPPPTPSPPGGFCQASIILSTPWQSAAGLFSSSVNVYLENTGSAPISVPYTVDIFAPGYVNTEYSWSWSVHSTSNQTQSGIVMDAWGTLQPDGNTYNFGSVVDSVRGDLEGFSPVWVTVNGIACAVSSAGPPSMPPPAPAVPGHPASAPPTPLPPPLPAGSCQYYSIISNPWPSTSGAGASSSSVNIYLQNMGSVPIPVPYVVDIAAPGYVNTQYTWNWDVTGTFNHTQRGIVKVPWGRLYPTDALQPNSNVVNIGAVVDSDFIDDMSFVPNAVAVNGVSCAMASAP